MRFADSLDENPYLCEVGEQDKNLAKYWLPFHELVDMSLCACESRKEEENKNQIS